MNTYLKLSYFATLLLCYAKTCVAVEVDPMPIVVWHGMGDSGFAMGGFKRFLQSHTRNAYVVTLTIGSSTFQDTLSGFWKNVNFQIEEVCQTLRNDEKFRLGYNAIGFSQGSQFLRAVAQRCPNPPMKNLISVGGQHQGVYGLPHCPAFISTICDLLRRSVSWFTYINFIQHSQVQLQYWHDPRDEVTYRQNNAFLADINQEQYVNPDYKTNLMKLENFVMIKFVNDTMVNPIETQWFGFYKSGQADDVESLRESELYIKDKLGLQEMDKSGKIHMLAVEGNHLQFSSQWFIQTIINNFLI